MVETRSGKMQDPAQERIKAEASAKPQPGATISTARKSGQLVMLQEPYLRRRRITQQRKENAWPQYGPSTNFDRTFLVVSLSSSLITMPLLVIYPEGPDRKTSEMGLKAKEYEIPVVCKTDDSDD
ncbi:hypothetical protein LAZ67_15000189, partial [Cordylochernes scorpioides]